MPQPRLSTLRSRLLNWYAKNKRTLPWRRSGLSPYAVWVSEIMLQQTRVETVIPYYESWLRLFPTVQALASASEQEVLNAWEGLGYYSRARNFHQAAKRVVEFHGGTLPRDLSELQKLPGVGKYTVGALASIVFGMDEPALDGNLKRVYARLFDLSEPVDSNAGEKMLWTIARETLPKGRAADFNQALMDLGALVCLPKAPRCLLCPVLEVCNARQNGTQELRPVKKPKKAVPFHVHAAAVIVRRSRVLLAQRSPTGLLAGMWEFPNGRVVGDPARELVKVIRTGYSLTVSLRRNVEPVGVFEHTYTHFRVTVHALMCELKSKGLNGSLKWVALADLETYPMGKVDRLIANTIKQRKALEPWQGLS